MTKTEITLCNPKSEERSIPFPINQSDFEDYFYLEDGKLFNKSNKKLFTGIINVLSLSQKLVSKWDFENGVENGAQYVYHENGQLASVTYVKNGIAEKTESYYKTGALYLEQDLVDGKTVYYYQNGKKKEEGISFLKKENLDDQKSGHWIYYYENGKKKEEGSWGMGGRHGDSNIKIGEWKYYDEDGNLTNTIEYDKYLGYPVKK